MNAFNFDVQSARRSVMVGSALRVSIPLPIRPPAWTSRRRQRLEFVMLSTLKIGPRINLGFSLLLCLLVTIGAVSSYGLWSAIDALSKYRAFVDAGGHVPAPWSLVLIP